MTRFGLTHQQLSNLLATGGEFRREEFRRQKKATDPVHNTIQYNTITFIWMLLKRGTGSGERGTGNGSLGTSCQRKPP